MDILGQLKEKITDSVINKISGFLGETPEEIASAIHSAIPAVFGGVIQHGATEKGAGQILDILKEGGHTGDILDDISGLLSNFDKTQVLITIGTNIFSYFLGDRANGVVDKLASITSIRRTSASSVLAFSSPLILGAIGKIVQKEGLGVSGLMKLLSSQQESINSALPPVLATQLNFKPKVIEMPVEKKKESVPVVPPVNKTEKIEEEKPGFFKQWIPWIFLALLVLASTIYVKKCKNTSKKDITTSDSLLLLPEKDAKKADTADAVTPPASNTVNTSTPKQEETKEVKSTTTPSTVVEKPAVVKPPQEVKPKVVEPKPKVEKISEEKKAVEKKSENTDLTFSSDWSDLSSGSFKRNSAEITNTSEIKKLAQYLKKNSSKKVSIRGYNSGSNTLSEDRAYAVREKLMEYGISDSRIDISTSGSSNGANGKVSIRIKGK